MGAVLSEQGVSIRSGHGVSGLLHRTTSNALARVTGVRLDDGTEISADITVVAGGRRSSAPDWLADIGAAAVPETVEDTGIVYFSRFYRLRPGYEWPPRTGTIGGDLGYLKYGVFAGDNSTFSITLAVSTDDDALRGVLDDNAVFDTVASNLVATAPYLDGRAEAITARWSTSCARPPRHRRCTAVYQSVIRQGLFHRGVARASVGRSNSAASYRSSCPGRCPRRVHPGQPVPLVSGIGANGP